MAKIIVVYHSGYGHTAQVAKAVVRGDKLNTLNSLYINAMQHGMIWVGNAQMVGGTTPNDINRLSSYTGVMTQSDQGPAEQFPPAGDLQTAENFGQRVAEITNQLLKGRAVL